MYILATSLPVLPILVIIMNLNVGENTKFNNKIDQHSIQHWSPKSKRAKLENDCENSLDNAMSLVEPDVMVDLGVSMLEDEEHSYDSIETSKSQEKCKSPCQEQLSNKECINSNGRVSNVRKSVYEPSEFNRSEQNLYHQDDHAFFDVINNESGYASRVESEALVDKQMLSRTDTSLQPSNDIDQFYLFRRKRRPSIPVENKFNKLSDEIILMILKWLPKKWLVQSMLVCKRWCEIARDEALWNRLDLGSKVLNAGTLGHILPRGVQVLRLAQAELADPVFLPSTDALVENYQSKLQYLDLSMAVITTNNLSKLLFKCKQLKHLSLEKGSLNEECCKAISQNIDITILNLTMCEGINVKGIKYLMMLQNLDSLNISWCSLDSKAVSTVCKLIPHSVARLNIAGCRKTITDSDVQELVTSCPNLIELDLSDCTFLTINSAQSILNLKKLEHLSMSRCYSIPSSMYFRLACMPSLMFLDVFGLMTGPMLKTLQGNSKGTKINKFLYSSVGRPTVGVRRTSIWGLRVRD